jgi:hypothetical protein
LPEAKQGELVIRSNKVAVVTADFDDFSVLVE